MRPLDPARQYSLHRATAERTLLPVRRDLARLQEHMATGLRVNRPSDDPEAFGRIRTLETLQHQHEGYARTIAAARLWTDRTQQELDRLADLLTEAQQTGLRGLTDTLAADDRRILAGRVDALLGEAVDAVNARAGRAYLFGGTATTQPPLSAEGEPTGPLTGALLRRIGPGLELAVNVPGAELLQVEGPDGPFPLLDALRGLAAALRREPHPAPDDPVPDLREAVRRVEAARDHVVALGTRAGEAAHRLTLAEDRLEEIRLTLASQRSLLEDADVIETTVELQKRQLALEAALRTTAVLAQRTLLDYLR